MKLQVPSTKSQTNSKDQSSKLERPEGAPELKPGVERSGTPGMDNRTKKAPGKGRQKDSDGDSATPCQGLDWFWDGSRSSAARSLRAILRRASGAGTSIPQFGTEIEASSQQLCLIRVICHDVFAFPR